MPSEMRMTVMWNPSAGSAQSAQDLKSTLGLRDRTIICEPGDRETAIVETVKAVTDGADVVVAAGGDGTVSSVVEGLTQSPRPATLGILPLGTGNDL
ncbi:MAG: acylglycerol kinase family protein, partial [Planctomycetaceae bacterium]|nr:acylglycerol kinase family protein [Planctomycetaceae bacterium]